jgi:hypothetical protein
LNEKAKEVALERFIKSVEFEERNRKSRGNQSFFLPSCSSLLRTIADTSFLALSQKNTEIAINPAKMTTHFK